MVDLENLEFLLFNVKSDALRFVQKNRFLNRSNENVYVSAPKEHNPKRFLGQWFIALLIIENPGTIDCRNLSVQFISETQGAPHFLHNFQVPYLMKKACLLFPLKLYLQKEQYK